MTNRNIGFTLLLVLLTSAHVALGQAPAPRSPLAQPATRPAPVERSETVLFPFDNYSVPFTNKLFLTLLPAEKSLPVVTLGGPGSPDERRIYFSGCTIIKIGDEYRMWYNSFSKDSKRLISYATSKDGLKWDKPRLGLVEFNGNKDNNLITRGGEAIDAMNALVLHEPDDPNPQRRFKMLHEIHPPNSVKVSFSPDGLQWTPGADDKFVVNIEPSGLIKRDGVYYLNGHGASRVPSPIPTRGTMHPQKRMMVTHISYDFEHWIEAAHISFRRDNLPPRPQLDYEFHKGEQVHTGAALWDRGNVVVGFYGQYHNPINDRRSVIVDLGLIVSNDALHFDEPLPDFKIVPSFEEVDKGDQRLTQSQAIENIGDKTFVYYGIWTNADRLDGPTGVRVASWPRDRLGYFSCQAKAKEACMISDLLQPARDARVYLNIDGLTEHSQVTVEILDEKCKPLPGYTAADFVPLTKSGGLRLPVAWREHETIGPFDQPIRVRVNWNGVRPEDIRLYAAYVQ
ncbi:MAG: hypothetical protein WBD40_19850 [Tepidisphaeraceae bacterium]